MAVDEGSDEIWRIEKKREKNEKEKREKKGKRWKENDGRMDIKRESVEMRNGKRERKKAIIWQRENAREFFGIVYSIDVEPIYLSVSTFWLGTL